MKQQLASKSLPTTPLILLAGCSLEAQRPAPLVVASPAPVADPKPELTPPYRPTAPTRVRKTPQTQRKPAAPESVETRIPKAASSAPADVAPSPAPGGPIQLRENLPQTYRFFVIP